ncbi:hypothetical protein [Thalassobacillus hwangdonensis]|uniref:Uncharacterized protein n=1 Tax=Thalassobacillus hwangdonensis TaxID=546108 RepID=A0ABW3L446_9BACI
MEGEKFFYLLGLIYGLSLSIYAIMNYNYYAHEGTAASLIIFIVTTVIIYFALVLLYFRLKQGAKFVMVSLVLLEAGMLVFYGLN